MVTRTTTADPGEHVESLADIAAAGQVLEAPPPDPAQAAQAIATEAGEIQCALELLRAAAIPFAPDHVQDPLHAVWNDKQLGQIAAAIVEICHLHGWTTGQFFGAYGPYIALLMALGIPVAVTLKLLKMPPPGATVAATDAAPGGANG